MLKGISWSDYLTYSGGALAIYYLLVFVWLGLKQRKRTSGKPGLSPNYFAGQAGNRKTGQAAAQNSGGGANYHPAAMPAIHDLVDELQAFISQAGHDLNKEELTGSLSLILQKYPVASDANYRQGLQSLIAVTVENKCNMHLSAEEVAALWHFPAAADLSS